MMPPIFVADLFPEISRHLVNLLRSLSAAEWLQPTLSSRRTVKDIASHLLDGSLRRLSMQRDDFSNAMSSRRADESLLDYLNRLNSEWEIGTRGLSPRVLIDLIQWADAQLATLFQSLDPHLPAIFPVAWAGEEQSQNWMDVAREYTEKWHHTQQIFDATNRRSTIMNRPLGQPCMDIFMRALPHAFRDVSADVGSVVSVVITGDAGGSWHIERTRDCWQQLAVPTRHSKATVTMDQDIAWRLLTKRRSREDIVPQFPGICFEGSEALGHHVLDMVSVMA